MGVNEAVFNDFLRYLYNSLKKIHSISLKAKI